MRNPISWAPAASGARRVPCRSRSWGGRGDASRAAGATTVAPSRRVLEAGERCRQFRQHSEECQRALSSRAVFQLAPVELSPRPSQHDRKRAQEGSISARETEREGKSCLRSEAPVRSPAAQRSAQSDQRLRRCLPVVGPLRGIHRDSIVSVSPAAVELAEEPCMTVLRRTRLDGPWSVVDGRPQREATVFSTGLKGLKIPVSVVRFRPWAP